MTIRDSVSYLWSKQKRSSILRRFWDDCRFKTRSWLHVVIISMAAPCTRHWRVESKVNGKKQTFILDLETVLKLYLLVA